MLCFQQKNKFGVTYGSPRFSTMFAAFTLQPSKNGLLGPVNSILGPRFPGLFQKLGNLHSHLERRAGARFAKMSGILHVDGLRLATAYAESVILRLALKPLLVIAFSFEP